MAIEHFYPWDSSKQKIKRTEQSSEQIGQMENRYYFAGRYVFGKRVLDYGCATGFGSEVLACRLAREVIGMEANADDIEYAREFFNKPNLRFEQQDLLNLSFEDDSFDVVVSLGAAEGVTDRSGWWRELSRVARIEGIIITAALVSPAGGRSFASVSGFNRYTSEQWKHYCEKVGIDVSYFLETGEEFQPWDGKHPGWVIAVCRGICKSFSAYTGFTSADRSGKRTYFVDRIKYVEKEPATLQFELYDKQGRGYKDYAVVFPDGEAIDIRHTRERTYADILGPTQLHQYRYIEPYLNQQLEALDCACGTGYGAEYLAERCRRVVGVDIDKTAVQYARKRYPGAEFMAGNAQQLPLTDGLFDVAVCVETLEHLEDGERFIEEVHRVLKPGGLILVTTPRRGFENPFHLREYWRWELVDLLSKHFAKERWSWITDDGRCFELICQKQGDNPLLRYNPTGGCREISPRDKVFFHDYEKFDIKRNLEDVNLIEQHIGRYQFASRFVEGKKVLDCGCGSGYGTAILTSNAKKAVGVDHDREAIEYAQHYYGGDNISFVHADLNDLSVFGKKKFDLITCFGVVEQMSDPRLFLKQAFRMLSPRGMLLVDVLCDPAGAPADDRYIKRRYLQQELAALLKCYFGFLAYYYQRGRRFYDLPTEIADSVVIACANPRAAAVNLAESLDETIRRGLLKRPLLVLPARTDYLRGKTAKQTSLSKAKRGRILIFHQPLPLYNDAYGSFLRYQRYYLLGQRMQAQGWEVTHFSNDELKQYYGDGDCLSSSDIYYQPETGDWEQTYIKTMLEDKLDAKELDSWRELYEKLLDRVAPDAVYMWNVNALLKRIVEDRDILLIHNEISVLRDPAPDSYFYDPRGVTGGSSVSELWEKKYKEQNLDADQKLLVDKVRREFFMREAHKISRAEIECRLGFNPRKKLVLLVLQVEMDSNIAAYSSFRSMKELIDLCLPQLGDDFNVIIKQHPSNERGYDFRDHDFGANVRVLMKEFSALSLANAADYVLTINSTSGFEALALHKRVFTFGNSYCSGLGMTIDGNDGLAEKIRQVEPILTEEECELIDSFLYFFIFQYSVYDDLMWNPKAQSAILEEWIKLKQADAPIISYWEALEKVGGAGPDERGRRLLEKYAQNLHTVLDRKQGQLEQSNHSKVLQTMLEQKDQTIQQQQQIIHSLVDTTAYKLFVRAVKLKKKILG